MNQTENCIERIKECINNTIYNRNYTIKSFAVRCGISYEEMRLIVNGDLKDIRLSTIERIAEGIGCNISDLIFKDISKEEQLINNIYHQLKIYKEYR